MSSSALSSLRGVLRVFLSPRRIGINNTLATMRDTWWERVAARLSKPRLLLYNRLGRSRSGGSMTPHDVRRKKGDLLRQGREGYRIRAGELQFDGAPDFESREERETVIGEIDQDGFLLPRNRSITGIPTVTEEEFVPRNRFGLTLVVRDGILAVRKDYRGNEQSFSREIQALDALARAECNVPALLDIDTERLHLVISYIAGDVLREVLAGRGAVLRDRDVEGHQSSELTPEELRLDRIREGRKYLGSVVDAAFTEALFRQLRIMHSRRFIWGDIKYGNVIIEKRSGDPYIIDFEGATYHPNLDDRSFRRLADSDIEKFNLHFGTGKLTTDRLRRKARAIPREDVYAPACFAAGIGIGDLWDNSCGYGRWRFILKDALPPLQGARVLDLGANNGFNSLQLLRSGAREVVGVELDEKYFEQGEFLRAAFEYSDYKSYEFRYLHANMNDVIKMDLGRFDFAMALCCIYYLPDDEIAALARHLSTITPTFVLQCNTTAGIGRSDPHTYVKASVDYAKKILSEAGFASIEVIAPPNYNRPLVIGRQVQ